MSDELIFREVDEELRQDQMARLWKRYGNVVIALALLIVLGVAGYRGWQWYAARQAAEGGERYEAALRQADEGKEADAIAGLEALAREGSGSYPLLARFAAAGLQAKTGNRDAAVAAYDALSNEAGDAALRDLARVEAARLLVDTAERSDIARRLAPVLAENSAWRNAARELIGLSALRTGDATGAADLFRQIATDATASQEIRQRAELMLAVLAPQEAAAQTQAEKPAGSQAEQPPADAAAKETAQ